MKKVFLSAAAAVLIALSSASAASVSKVNIGFLSRLNISEEDFRRIIQHRQGAAQWRTLSKSHDDYGVQFYDTMTAMIMALSREDVNEIALPEVIGDYLIDHNNSLVPSCISRSNVSLGLAFGFKKSDAALAEKFNNALRAIKEDWTLSALQGSYIYNKAVMRPVKFDTFKGAKTVKVAVTGDLPPIDYIDEAGRPAGFNAALLAELGRRMKVNMKLLNINAGARTAALVSGRADVVFWYETAQDKSWKCDAPEDILLSEPYYFWNKFLHIRHR